ncbi:MAG: hypothetical protein IT557_15245 [Alphaproteobacteria bacterium]|nr:hypothetical protein [Alphaproteobacteria bacterium]
MKPRLFRRGGSATPSGQACLPASSRLPGESHARSDDRSRTEPAPARWRPDAHIDPASQAWLPGLWIASACTISGGYARAINGGLIAARAAARALER